MDIKFSLQDVSIQAPELQADVKIGHMNYEVVGLDLKDYAQLAAKLPALILDIRKAMAEEVHIRFAPVVRKDEDIDLQHAPHPNETNSYHPDF